MPRKIEDLAERKRRKLASWRRYNASKKGQVRNERVKRRKRLGRDLFNAAMMQPDPTPDLVSAIHAFDIG